MRMIQISTSNAKLANIEVKRAYKTTSFDTTMFNFADADGQGQSQVSPNLARLLMQMLHLCGTNRSESHNADFIAYLSTQTMHVHIALATSP